MDESRSRYLLNNTLIFLIGNIGTRLITFFLVPLYTNVLSTEEYGIADLITTFCSVLAPILILNISESIMRFELDKDVNTTEITKIGIIILLLSFFGGMIFVPLYNLFPGLSEYSIYIFLYNLSVGASTIFLYDLRGKELLFYFSVSTIILTLISAGLNIIFLAGFKMGIKGYLLSYIIAHFITALYAAFVGNAFKGVLKAKFNKIKAVEMVRFSIILIPNTFMWWIMDYSDRVMITEMLGASYNGIYAISYKLPTLVSVLTGIFNQAWNYSAIKIEGEKDEIEYNNSVFKNLTSIAILIGIVLLVIMKPFLKIYVDESYYSAWMYTPFLVIGCVYLTMGTFMSSAYNVHKDSMGFLLSASIGAIINIVMNYFLIPVFHVYGAAFATCISYISVFVFRYFHVRKYIRYQINNKEFILGSILLTITSLAIYMENYLGLIIQLIILFSATFLYRNIWFNILKQGYNIVIKQ